MLCFKYVSSTECHLPVKLKTKPYLARKLTNLTLVTLAFSLVTITRLLCLSKGQDKYLNTFGCLYRPTTLSGLLWCVYIYIQVDSRTYRHNKQTQNSPAELTSDHNCSLSQPPPPPCSLVPAFN